MSRFRFELATAADDAGLRQVLAETPMEGRIAVAFRREPSWFAAAVIDGDERQVVACRDTESGQIVGFGSRSLRLLYVDGRPRRVGYLSSLRLLSAYRNRGLVARGYAYFRRLHDDGLAPYYLTTIAAGNAPALKVLTSARAGLPCYVPAGLYHTLAIPLRKGRSRSLAPNLGVRPATRDDLPAILNLLAEHGPRRQFFPLVQESDLSSGAGPFLGLSLDDILLAWRGTDLVGMLGAWDQYAYKQSVVTGYQGPLAYLRPALNAWWSLRGRPRLPAPGEPLRYRIAALPVVREDSAEVTGALLTSVSGRLAGGTDSHFMFGLHERDPLLPAVRRWSAACYTTHLYLVSWGDAAQLKAIANRRVPYLELGTL
jgi:hypothetical protein